MKKNITEITVPIEGMRCASCAALIERNVKSLDGVESVNVNLANEKSYIKFNSEKIRIDDINSAIEKGGFKALPVEDNSESDYDSLRNSADLKSMRLKMILSSIFTIPLFYIAMAPMIPILKGALPVILDPMISPLIYALVELALVLPIMIIGRKFYINGVNSVLNRSLNMDTLISVGTASAFLYSVYSTLRIASGAVEYAHNLYFETTGVIITLILLGKTLEATSKNRTNQAIKKLLNLTPSKALILVDNREVEVPVKSIKIGDIVIIKPGDKIPIDGVVTEGYTSIDESMITGESVPVEKVAGDKVIGGTVNKNGSIIIKVEKVGKETALAQIIKLVEQAQGSKAPIAKLADVVSGYFVPVVIVIAIVSSVSWFIAGKDFVYALKIFTAVMVVACPCALGLATPTALMVGMGRGAENGILLKSGEALEIAHSIDTIVFDKTGTLTYGKPVVTDISSFSDYNDSEILKFCASVEKKSDHPLADAIVKESAKRGVELLNLELFNYIPGLGASAKIDGKFILIGNRKLLQKYNVNFDNITDASGKIDKFESEGKTVICIVINEKLAGIIACRDNLKVGVKDTIARLKTQGITTVMLTGDNKRTAMTLAKEAGIDIVVSEAVPEDKTGEIVKLKKNGRKVAMVGDGINDAPALAASDLGIAIGSGTDVAIESADIVLMRSDLNDVAKALYLSKITIRNVKQNLFWAFAYNVVLIPIAAGFLSIFNGPQLNPMLAAGAMSLSSLSVVSNALRLKFIKLK